MKINLRNIGESQSWEFVVSSAWAHGWCQSSSLTWDWPKSSWSALTTSSFSPLTLEQCMELGAVVNRNEN